LIVVLEPRKNAGISYFFGGNNMDSENPIVRDIRKTYDTMHIERNLAIVD